MEFPCCFIGRLNKSSYFYVLWMTNQDLMYVQIKVLVEIVFFDLADFVSVFSHGHSHCSTNNAAVNHQRPVNMLTKCQQSVFVE